jgi:hypothetical protein
MSVESLHKENKETRRLVISENGINGDFMVPLLQVIDAHTNEIVVSDFGLIGVGSF